jgi:hypothetical protein
MGGPTTACRRPSSKQRSTLPNQPTRRGWEPLARASIRPRAVQTNALGATGPGPRDGRGCREGELPTSRQEEGTHGQRDQHQAGHEARQTVAASTAATPAGVVPWLVGVPSSTAIERVGSTSSEPGRLPHVCSALRWVRPHLSTATLASTRRHRPRTEGSGHLSDFDCEPRAPTTPRSTPSAPSEPGTRALRPVGRCRARRRALPAGADRGGRRPTRRPDRLPASPRSARRERSRRCR